MRLSVLLSLPLATGVALLAAPRDLSAQSLRGSQKSVGRMHGRAVANDLRFHQNSRTVRTATRRGELVPLGRSPNYLVTATGDTRVVLPATRTFVQRLASQYRAACGQRLVVTGALRPTSRRLANGSPRSVHPTGMAIDLRKPSGKCLTWLRRTLLELERTGVIEATEEHRPPHFHVAVFPRAYGRYVAARSGSKSGGTSGRRSAGE